MNYSTSETVPAAYYRGIESTSIEKEMTIKNLKLSVTMIAAVVSLFALTSVVVG